MQRARHSPSSPAPQAAGGRALLFGSEGSAVPGSGDLAALLCSLQPGPDRDMERPGSGVRAATDGGEDMGSAGGAGCYVAVAPLPLGTRASRSQSSRGGRDGRTSSSQAAVAVEHRPGPLAVHADAGSRWRYTAPAPPKAETDAVWHWLAYQSACEKPEKLRTLASFTAAIDAAIAAPEARCNPARALHWTSHKTAAQAAEKAGDAGSHNVGHFPG